MLLSRMSTNMKKHCISKIVIVTVLALLIGIVPNSFAVSKRVAVLYFEDHSHFDSPTGCGLIPTSIGKIFGGKKKRWDLEAGFHELLNRKLKQTPVYEPISQDDILDAMASLGLSRKSLEASPEKRSVLAKELKAEVLIVGDIRKFNQERARANASRTLREGGREQQGTTGSFVGGVQVLGRAYFTSIKLDMRFYGISGAEITTSKISASKRHQLGGAQIAALRVVVTEEGTELEFGQMSSKKKKFRPIVDAAKLNQIKFGSAEYDRTLLGLTTDEALDKVVLAMRENIGPAFIWPPNATDTTTTAQNDKRSSTSRSTGPIIGKIVFVNADKPEETYINIGSATGIVIGQQLTVFRRGEPLTDPDTGEILDYISEKIGKAEVVEVRSDRLSKVRITEGFGKIERGDGVKVESSARPTIGRQ